MSFQPTLRAASEFFRGNYERDLGLIHEVAHYERHAPDQPASIYLRAQVYLHARKGSGGRRVGIVGQARFLGAGHRHHAHQQRQDGDNPCVAVHGVTSLVDRQQMRAELDSCSPLSNLCSQPFLLDNPLRNS
jgi:hypothetical protein